MLTLVAVDVPAVEHRILYGAPQEESGAVVLALYPDSTELWVITHTDTSPADVLALRSFIPAAAELLSREEVTQFANREGDFAAVDFYSLREVA